MTSKTATPTIGSIQLVQAISGCVQLRASDASATVWLNTLGQQLRSRRGVLAVYTDATTGYLIIVFDPSGLPLAEMLSILQQWGVSGINVPQTPALQVGQFLQQHHEVEAIAPMIVGMVLTQTLRLRGGWALLANLVGASVTRQALEQLEKNSEAAIATGPNEAIAALPEAPAEEVETERPVAIVHAIPGRVRFRVPALSGDRECAERLQTLLAADRRITSARINRLAASAIVVYESDGVSDNEIILEFVELIKTAIGETSPSETESQTTARETMPGEGEGEKKYHPPAQNNGNLAREKPGENREPPGLGMALVDDREAKTAKEAMLLEGQAEEAWSYFNPCFARALFNSVMTRIMGSNSAEVSKGEG